ncbi:glycosyltransferase family 2 protein [Sulfurovum sp.]|uniref:glycosyltransferase family 2 protein n=1 Tax=Sulfurovum sp. TaxID=1969726 RepID=UPI00356280BA
MKISIAMATYNGAAYLQDQLDSYLSQKRLPDELVVCDDGSTDETVVILEAFQKVAPFQVQIIKNENNLGYTKNFEKALSLCTGDVVFFSDQDDVWLPGKISTIEKVFNDNPDISLVIHDAELVNENLEPTGLTKLGQIRSGGYSDNSFATGTLSAIRRDILNIILPFPDGIAGGHDGWVHIIARLVDRRMIVSDVLQKLRRHSNNTSEWVASSLTRIRKIDVAKSQFFATAADSYRDRLLYNESLAQRFIKVRSGEISCPFTIDFKQIELVLEREYKALLKRQDLLSHGFIGRKICALSMLINRDYQHFNGVRSFIRDFLR